MKKRVITEEELQQTLNFLSNFTYKSVVELINFLSNLPVLEEDNKDQEEETPCLTKKKSKI